MSRRQRASAMALSIACTILVAAAACTPRVSTGSPGAPTQTATPASLPRITRLEPDSASITGGRVVEVKIHGSGFVPGEPGANTIDFAGMMLTNIVANAAGTEIRFTVPQRLNRGGEPRPRPVMPGPYEVRVTNASGTSNAVVLRVIE